MFGGSELPSSLASEEEAISGRQFSRNVAACTLARAADQSPPTALRRRQARPFTAELALTRVSPGQGLLSLLGPTIPCRGRTFTCKHVKDRRLHIGICFWRAQVLGFGNWKRGRLWHTTCRANRRCGNTSNSVSSGVSGVKGFKLQRLDAFVGFGAGMRRGPGKTMYRFGQPARSTRRRRRPATSIRQACRARMNGVGSLA